MAAGLLCQVQHLRASPPSEGLLSQPEAPPGSVTGKRCCPSKENKVNVQMSLSNKPEAVQTFCIVGCGSLWECGMLLQGTAGEPLTPILSFKFLFPVRL